MWINGLASDTISASDRGLQYGDGLFETIRISKGQPVLWAEHLGRLQSGCQALRIPLDVALLSAETTRFLAQQQAVAGVLKILITRGAGGRGYAPAQQVQATRILQLHPLPDYPDAAFGVKATVCKHPVSSNSQLAGLKHLNRLDQVMASMELGEHYAEGLMTDEQGNMIEGTRSNIFLVLPPDGKSGAPRLTTPSLEQAGVAGIMRAFILQQCQQHNVPVTVTKLNIEQLKLASEVFICNSVFGIWPITELHHNMEAVHWPVGPFTKIAQQWLHQCLDY